MMAEPDAVASGVSSSWPAREQRADAVELKSIDAASKTDEAAPSTPAKDAPETLTTEAKGKGKEKEAGDDVAASSAAALQAQIGRQRSDSLSIDDAPSAMDAAAGSSSTPDGGPVCNITLLLPTGARHPYRLDEKYLAKRGVELPEMTEAGKKDPFSISIYKLKELILREWREDWDNKPASPSSIRLIHFGKLLEDKEQLKKYQFSAEAPNVVHMSVRPAEMLEEDEASKGKGGGQGGRNRDGGGGCCVIL